MTFALLALAIVAIALAETRARAASLGGPVAGQQFFYNLEWWRPLFTEYGGAQGIPGDVMVEWIREESEGNPVAVGNPYEVVPDATGKWPREVGIFQLYNPDDFVGTGHTPAGYRAYAKPGYPFSQEMTRPMTPDEAVAQVADGIHLIRRNENRAVQILTGHGQHWGGYDYWAMVKLLHGLPGLAAGGFNAATQALGRPPSSFTEFRRTVMGLNLVAPNPAPGFDANTWAYRSKFSSIFANADRVGRAAGVPTT